MRWLDYWVGRPLCWALTMWSRLARLGRFGSGRDAGGAPPRNVLIIELAEMGSTVVAYPALQQLRARHPDCRLFFLVFTALGDSVKMAQKRAYDTLETIRFDGMQFRRDIGFRAIPGRKP